MRPVLHSDLISAARTLREIPPDRRGAVADRMLAHADAADRYRRRFGRAHPDWGNGTLMALAAKAPLPAAPDLQDREFIACLMAVLGALGRFVEAREFRSCGTVKHNDRLPDRSKEERPRVVASRTITPALLPAGSGAPHSPR